MPLYFHNGDVKGLRATSLGRLTFSKYAVSRLAFGEYKDDAEGWAEFYSLIHTHASHRVRDGNGITTSGIVMGSNYGTHARCLNMLIVPYRGVFILSA